MVGRARRSPSDVAGIGWIVLIALLLLSPALKDGHNFGPTDLGSGLSTLTAGAIPPSSTQCIGTTGAPVATCAHDSDNGDTIDQAVPWNTTDWELVHHGHLPLWDTTAGTGEPQLLNFESSVLALPTLVGYLFPLSWSFLVTVLMKLLIAGLGAYWCARVLGARAIAATLGGVSFMCSGAIDGWLGWSISGVLVFAGPILAAAVLTYRHRARVGPPFLLALTVAFAVFGGFPEAYVLEALCFGAAAVAAGAAALLLRRGIAFRGVARCALGVAGGLGCSSVLWLPGIAVLRASVRGGEVGATGLPLHYVALLFAPGYDGIPIAGSAFFGNLADPGLYFETASSVTLIAFCFGCVALALGRRRPVVWGLAALGVVALALSFQLGSVHPVQRLIIDVGLKSVVLSRALALFGFAASILGALGLEALVARHAERGVRRTFAVAVGVVAVPVVVLSAKALGGGLPGTFAHLRRESLYWPLGTLLLLVGSAVALEVAHRSLERTRPAVSGGRTAHGEMAHGGAAHGGIAHGGIAHGVIRALPIALVVVGSAAGLFGEVGISSYAHTAFPKTTATNALARIVGTSLLGIDGGNRGDIRTWEGIGFYPEMNTAYGIDELGLHDPTISSSYFASWPVPGADPGGALHLFAPDVDTVALARRYGVQYVLSAPGFPTPPGMRKVADIAGGVLSVVPGSARFTLDGAPVTATHPGDARYVVDTSGRSGQLVARITDSPGWGATAGGTTLALHPLDGAFYDVTVPPGVRAVTFTYRPPHLTVALGLGAVSLLGFAAAAIWERRRRRSDFGQVTAAGSGTLGG